MNGPEVHPRPYFDEVDQFGHPMDEPCHCDRPASPWPFVALVLGLVFQLVVLLIAIQAAA